MDLKTGPQPPRILLIDDNESIHQDFRKILNPDSTGKAALESAGAALFGNAAPVAAGPSFEIDSAFQGKEGFAKVCNACSDSRPYSMAFVDIRMPPGWDGIETISRIWEKYADLEIVICTAYSDYSLDQIAERLGVTDRLVILKKPFDTIEVLQLARALTEKWELRRRAREHLAETEQAVLSRTAELRDTNERLRAEIVHRELVESMLLRSQRLESIGTLATGIAHDLNNLLSPMLMGAPLLAGKQVDPELEMVVDAIKTNAARAADVVRQLVNFARGVPGKHTALNPASILAELNKSISGTFPKNIELTFPQSPPLLIFDGDSTQLQQVFLNLCVNARDSMPGGGKLTIEAEAFDADEYYASMMPESRPGPYMVIRVSDTGSGIPLKVLDKIFDPFFTTKAFGQGSGLGLSTASGIVRGHGGFINVNSQPGRGTTFEVFLPARREEAAPTLLLTPKLAPRGSNELVLVVDDESIALEMTTAVLRENGYQTIAASDGCQALGVYAQRARDIAAVLTSIVMPIVDGVSLCRSLRKLNPLVKVIASSEELENRRQLELDSLGFNGLLTKPYRADTLLSTLQSVLQNANLPALHES